MANTYIPIQTVTASSGSIAAIEFTSISGSYKDLLIKASLRGTNGDSNFALQVRFNDSSATSQYYTEGMSGSQSGNISSGVIGVSGQSGLSYLYTGNPTANPQSSTAFSNLEIYIADYASTSRSKVYVEEVHGTGDTNANIFQQLFCGIWANNSAITKISMYNEYGSFSQYTTATLYGIS